MKRGGKVPAAVSANPSPSAFVLSRVYIAQFLYLLETGNFWYNKSMSEKFKMENRNISEELQKLDVARKEVENLSDKLGLKIDQGIKETVAVFRAMDFPTESSCAGHTNESGGEGYGFPYVRVYAPAPQGWAEDKTNKELGEKWKQENLKFRLKIEPLLEEFNKMRTSTNDALLHLDNMGLFGAFTVESIGVKNSKKITSKEEAVVKTKLFQEEMRLFTEFLINKFLNKNS